MTFRWKLPWGPTSPAQEVLRCAFCSKGEHDVRKLIAGPTVFICDECVSVCNDIIADDEKAFELKKYEILPPPKSSKPPTSGRRLPCTLCGMSMSWEESLLIPERGALCPGCVGEVEIAIARARESAE
jgi:hypothetical protein